MCARGVGNPRSSRCFRKFESCGAGSGFPNVFTADRLHNRGSFPRGLSNGTYLRQQRKHQNSSDVPADTEESISQHSVVGKEQLKQCLAVAAENKNDQMRCGGLQGEEDE